MNPVKLSIIKQINPDVDSLQLAIQLHYSFGPKFGPLGLFECSHAFFPSYLDGFAQSIASSHSCVLHVVVSWLHKFSYIQLRRSSCHLHNHLFVEVVLTITYASSFFHFALVR